MVRRKNVPLKRNMGVMKRKFGLQSEEGLKQLVEDILGKYPECIEKSTALN